MNSHAAAAAATFPSSDDRRLATERLMIRRLIEIHPEFRARPDVERERPTKRGFLGSVIPFPSPKQAS